MRPQAADRPLRILSQQRANTRRFLRSAYGAFLIPAADSAAPAPDGSLRRGGRGLRRFRRTAHFPVPIRQKPSKCFGGDEAQPNAVDAQEKTDTIKRRHYGKEKTRRHPVGVGRRQSGFRQPLLACPLPAFLHSV